MNLSFEERQTMASAIGSRIVTSNSQLYPWEQKVELSNTKLFLLSRLEKINGLPQILIHNGIKDGTIKVVD